MESFNFVVFGFTSNLAQLKIIPALYDLEKKGKLSPNTKIFGIGRKEIDVNDFVNEVLHSENRHHVHKIETKIKLKLINRIEYIKENFEEKDGPLYTKLQSLKGNILYYLATYPNLYTKIFQSLKDCNLNREIHGWVRIMIEKPIGNDLKTAKDLDNLLSRYFNEKQIYRVDHYLGKESLRNIFGTDIKPINVDRLELYISENFGIGKRGIYYDVTGALIDMGQNHLLQMLAAVTAKSSKRPDRAEVLKSLIPEPKNILFGQYEGYLKEENVSPVSVTDTFFALKTKLRNGLWRGVPIYLASGKKLKKNIAEVIIHFKNNKSKVYVISPTKVPEQFDPYERLIMDAINGDSTFFNSKQEIEASWKFIDRLSLKNDNPFIYKPGSNLTNRVASKFAA